jgi:hypothetical protein
MKELKKMLSLLLKKSNYKMQLVKNLMVIRKNRNDQRQLKVKRLLRIKKRKSTELNQQQQELN